MSKKTPREKLEAAARAYLSEWGYVYDGSILECAESTDPKVYNPRCAKAVEAARKILKAAL